MEHIKKFENSGTPWTYRNLIRNVTNYLPEICGNLNKYTTKIIKLIATNKTSFNKFGDNVINSSNPDLYILKHFKDLVDTVTYTDNRGLLGELIVGDLLKNKFKLNVIEPTDAEDISGIDLITIGNRKKTHQVKIIYNYDDSDNKTFKIYNKFLDIKPTDKYDYIWFFSENTNEVIGFNHIKVTVNQVSYGYNIHYKEIKKYNIDIETVEHFKKVAKEKIYGMLSPNIKDIFNNYLEIYEKLSLIKSVNKYNL